MENNNVCAETNETMASIFFSPTTKTNSRRKKKAGEDVGGGE